MTIKKYICMFFVFIAISGSAYAEPSVKVTVKVLGEDGIPIENARVTVNFADGSNRRKSDVTDSDGLAILSGGSTGFIQYSAGKEGYYSTAYMKTYNKVTGIYGFRRFQPWNEMLSIVLKKVIQPRELYIGNNDRKRLGVPLELPASNKKYGFDLTANDWVVPYGQGTHRDFIFKLVDNNSIAGIIPEGRAFDYTLTLTFANEEDGIQPYSAPPIIGSRLRLPHKAPVDGYKSELIQRKARTDERFTHNDFPEDRNYFFRVRTVIDDNGNIESALYGKIYGNINFSRKTITMLYYLNPDTNDRNLESDYKKNLFPSKQRYGYPEYPP